MVIVICPSFGTDNSPSRYTSLSHVKCVSTPENTLASAQAIKYASVLNHIGWQRSDSLYTRENRDNKDLWLLRLQPSPAHFRFEKNNVEEMSQTATSSKSKRWNNDKNAITFLFPLEHQTQFFISGEGKDIPLTCLISSDSAHHLCHHCSSIVGQW